VAAAAVGTTLVEMEATLTSLVGSKDSETLSHFISTVDHEVLRDLFLRYLGNLPPRHAWVPDNVPHEPWLNDLTRRLIEDTRSAAMASDAGVLLEKRDNLHKEVQAVAAAQIETKVAAIFDNYIPIPIDALSPLPLSDQGESVQRLNAVLRILNVQKTRSHALRAALVGRLAACAPDTDRITDGLLDYIFEVRCLCLAQLCLVSLQSSIREMQSCWVFESYM